MSNRNYSLSQYPLSWPEGWTRTPAYRVRDGRFLRNKQLPSIMEGLNRVLRELDAMGVRKDDVLISTNVPTRLDGMPRSDQREPSDRAVAVYWRKDQKSDMQCIAIDIYNRVADNLCAVAATLEALRAIERHGGAQVQERSFRGFKALSNETGARGWRQVLGLKEGVTYSRAEVEAQYKAAAKLCHPDTPGGSNEAMAAVNAAREQAFKEL